MTTANRDAGKDSVCFPHDARHVNEIIYNYTNSHGLFRPAMLCSLLQVLRYPELPCQQVSKKSFVKFREETLLCLAKLLLAIGLKSQ